MDYRQLHRDALLIDTHNDTIVAHIRRGNLSLHTSQANDVEDSDLGFYGLISFARGESREKPAMPLQLEFAKMRAGGIDAGFFAVDVTLAHHNHLAYALDGLGYCFAALGEAGSDVVVVRRGDDITRAKAEEKLAAVLALEHANCTEKSLNVLRALYELGVRSTGLTHNVSSYAA